MPQKVTVTKTDAGKFQALDSTNKPIVEADSQEEVKEFFSELPPGDIELTFPAEVEQESTTESKDSAGTGKKSTGDAGQEQTEDESEESKQVVPLAALKAERSKRQNLETALSDVAALRQELAQMRQSMVKPAEEDSGDDDTDNAPVTKKDLVQYFGELEKRQKASQADSVLKEMSSMDKPDGFLLEPGQIIELTAPFLKGDLEARRLLVESEDRTAALKDLERIALMTIALKDPSSFPGLGKKPTSKPASKEAASVAATRKIDALAAGSKIHDALSQAGDGGGDLTDPIAGHIAKLQSLTGTPGYALYWAKLPADVRKQIDEKLE